MFKKKNLKQKFIGQSFQVISVTKYCAESVFKIDKRACTEHNIEMNESIKHYILGHGLSVQLSLSYPTSLHCELPVQYLVRSRTFSPLPHVTLQAPKLDHGPQSVYGAVNKICVKCDPSREKAPYWNS